MFYSSIFSALMWVKNSGVKTDWILTQYLLTLVNFHVLPLAWCPLSPLGCWDKGIESDSGPRCRKWLPRTAGWSRWDGPECRCRQTGSPRQPISARQKLVHGVRTRWRSNIKQLTLPLSRGLFYFFILQDIRSVLHNDTCSPFENEAHQMPTKVKKKCREVQVEKNTVFRIPVSQKVYVVYVSHSNR